MMEQHLRDYVTRVHAALEALPRDTMGTLGELLFRAYQNDKQVFVIGNDGSASTASHMAADLAKNTIGPNMRRFRIHSLNDNISLVTALANDIGYDHIFSEQLENSVRAGDVLIVISGSGNSRNVLNAMRYARRQSAQVVALLGFDGGAAIELADITVLVQSRDYGIVEDMHLVVNHILVEYFSKLLAASRPSVV
jgi:D-sedoheptulose 7-phosphate isomerase